MIAPAAQRSIDAAGLTAIILACATWGLNQVAVKLATEAIPPVAQAGLRSVVAAVLIVAWIGLRGRPVASRDGTLWSGVAAGVTFAADFAFFYLGLSLTTAARAVLFLYLTPFLVTIGAHFLLSGDRLTARKSLGLVAAFAGLMLVLGESLTGTGGGSLVGDLLCMLGAVGWAANTLIIRRTRIGTVPADRQLLYMHGVAAPVMLAMSLALGEPAPTAGSVMAWTAFAYTAVIVAFASYLLWYRLLAVYRASELSAFTFLTPVLGVAAGHVILGDPLTPRFLLALGCVVAGIVLVNWRPRATR